MHVYNAHLLSKDETRFALSAPYDNFPYMNIASLIQLILCICINNYCLSTCLWMLIHELSLLVVISWFRSWTVWMKKGRENASTETPHGAWGLAQQICWTKIPHTEWRLWCPVYDHVYFRSAEPVFSLPASKEALHTDISPCRHVVLQTHALWWLQLSG